MFDQLGKQTQQMNPVQQIKNNPFSYLQSKGFNIPQNMNNPQAIMNYLLQSGQIGNQKMQMAQQMLQNMMKRK